MNARCYQNEDLETKRKRGRESMARWRKAHPEEAKELNRKHRELGRDRNKVNRKAKAQAKKDLVHSHYGSKCECCGEKNRGFLCIDHINNDGYAQKRKNGRANIYDYAIKNNSRPTYVFSASIATLAAPSLVGS